MTEPVAHVVVEVRVSSALLLAIHNLTGAMQALANRGAGPAIIQDELIHTEAGAAAVSPIVEPKPASNAGSKAPAAPAKPPVADPIPVDLAQLTEWAGVRGIVVEAWSDLDTVNAKRDALKLPRFKRAPTIIPRTVKKGL